MDWPVPELFVLAGAGLVVLLVAGLVVAARRERERQARIRAWAAHYDWPVTTSPAVD